MIKIRETAVAGTFYPSDPQELRGMVEGFLQDAGDVEPPKAIIAPHAGYVYSGLTAGYAYGCLRPLRDLVRRVVLLGPSHTMPLRGMAAVSVDAFACPLGRVDVDHEGMTAVLDLPQVSVLDAAHRREHGLEVHLPFLKTVLSDFSIIPLVVGLATTDETAQLLERLWGGAETLIVISSDLSHFYDYAAARALDEATAQAIEGLQPEKLGRESACGRIPIQGLLAMATRRGLTARRLDLRNSGDTAGSRSRVVGYGAWAFG